MAGPTSSAAVDEFNNAVREVLTTISAELGRSAALSVVDEDPHGTTWLLQPANPDAVAITVDSAGWDAVTVALGDFALMELGWERDATPASVLAHLEDVCRSVASGRLSLLRKRGSNAVRYRLVLSDGEAVEGSQSWLFPVMPWTSVEHIEAAPYA